MSELGPFQRAMLRAKEELGDFDEAWAEVEKRRELRADETELNELRAALDKLLYGNDN